MRVTARALGRAVGSLCERTGYDRVHVIAHSLGGVIARYCVQRLGGDARVRTLVTLGAPHGGTWAARALPPRLPFARQIGYETAVALADLPDQVSVTLRAPKRARKDMASRHSGDNPYGCLPSARAPITFRSRRSQ